MAGPSIFMYVTTDGPDLSVKLLDVHDGNTIVFESVPVRIRFSTDEVQVVALTEMPPRRTALRRPVYRVCAPGQVGRVGVTPTRWWSATSSMPLTNDDPFVA